MLPVVKGLPATKVAAAWSCTSSVCVRVCWVVCAQIVLQSARAPLTRSCSILVAWLFLCAQAGAKDAPVPYEGGRDASSMVEFIKANAGAATSSEL